MGRMENRQFPLCIYIILIFYIIYTEVTSPQQSQSGRKHVRLKNDLVIRIKRFVAGIWFASDCAACDFRSSDDGNKTRHDVAKIIVAAHISWHVTNPRRQPMSFVGEASEARSRARCECCTNSDPPPRLQSSAASATRWMEASAANAAVAAAAAAVEADAAGMKKIALGFKRCLIALLSFAIKQVKRTAFEKSQTSAHATGELLGWPDDDPEYKRHWLSFHFPSTAIELSSAHDTGGLFSSISSPILVNSCSCYVLDFCAMVSVNYAWNLIMGRTTEFQSSLEEFSFTNVGTSTSQQLTNL